MSAEWRHRLSTFYERPTCDGCAEAWPCRDQRYLDALIVERDAAIRRAAGPFDAQRMTHAWSILTSEVDPDRWEPDRYNAAAFVRALLDKYEWLETATLEDLAPKYVAALRSQESQKPPETELIPLAPLVEYARSKRASEPPETEDR